MKRRPWMLFAIAAFKFVKAALLIALGIGMLEHHLPHALMRMLRHLSGARQVGFSAAGIGAFAYAALFTVEGIGLSLQKHWAEYLTVISTALLIPFECFELAHRITALRLAAFVVNIGIVVYLIQRLRERGAK